MNFRTFFHYLSYLQYPLMLVAVYCVIAGYIADDFRANPESIFKATNTALIFMGLAISFSSLQDTSKTQNELSKKIWENPQKGKVVIIAMCSMIFFYLILGLIGYFRSENGILKDLSIGILVLALGMFGFLKAAIEMYENHRKDKNPESQELKSLTLLKNKSKQLLEK